MDLQDKMDQLAAHIGDLGTIEAELQKYERDIAQGVGGVGSGKPTIEGIRSMAQVMLDTINKSGSFFREQTEVIRKISPPAAEQMDDVLVAYENLQAVIEGEFQRESEKGDGQYMRPELVERLDAHMHELGRLYTEMRKAMTLAYNCIVGTVNFMASGGARKAGRGAGRGGWKRVR